MRRMFVVLAAFVLITSGCFWDQPGFDATGSNNNPTETRIGVNNVASLHTQWSMTLDHIAVGVTQSDVGLIDISDGTTLAAVDPATRATVWSRTEPSGVTVSGATGDGNNILVTTTETPTNPDGSSGPTTANLEVRDARTGATVSTIPIAPTGEVTPPAPTVSGVTKSGPWVVTVWSYFATLPLISGGQGGFQVTNLDDPSLSWRFDPNTSNSTLDAYVNPVIVGDRLYLEHANSNDLFGYANSTIAAWNLSGCTNQCAPLFETGVIASQSQPASGIALINPIGSQDGRAVYAGVAGGFDAVDPATGATQEAGTSAGNSRVLATTGDAEVVGTSVFSGGYQLAVYPATCAAAPCAPTWTTSLPDSNNGNNARGVTKAAVANGVIYATLDYENPTYHEATDTLAAYPLDCTDGCQPLWTMPVGDQLIDEVRAGPIVSNGQILYGLFEGTLSGPYGGKVVALTP